MGRAEKGFHMMMLIKEIYSNMHCQVGSSMKDSGLTTQQILVMKLIAHNKEMTSSQLCEELSLSKATISGIVGRLEEAGYLQKEKRDTDKRNTYITFTPKGMDFAISFKKSMNNSFNKVLESLTDDEVTHITKDLELLAYKMKEEDK